MTGHGGSQKGKSPSRLIDERIKELGDWRGKMLSRLRALIKQADPEVVEEWKWRGVPVWSHEGLICTGETSKSVVKMTFAKGAALEDPAGLFNASLDGNTRRAIDFHEGEKIDEAAVKALIRAAVKLTRPSGATRIGTVNATVVASGRRARVCLLSLILLLCVALAAEAAEAAEVWNVGYRKIEVQDPLTGELFPVALWYPTSTALAPLFVTGSSSLSLCRLPTVLCRWIAFEMTVAHDAPPAAGQFGLIVVSHGAGGMALLHRDLAMALASQGYAVAAPTHPRGQSNDASGVGVWIGRPKQVTRVIDVILEDGQLASHIDRKRIGVAGHSNGGFTALAVAGARPSTGAVTAHCRQHPDDVKFCAFGGAATRAATREVGPIPDLVDPRVRSIVLMAPNAAPFTDEALAKVAVPALVYGAENDDLTRVKYHAERLVRALPRVEFVLVKGAGHFSFVASFPTGVRIIAGDGARDPSGFDRDAFHEVMNREIVEFFNRTLRKLHARGPS